MQLICYRKEAKEKSYEDHLRNDNIYKIVQHPKGRVLLINNEFKTSPNYTREGAGKDGLKMQQLWKGIGCTVIHAPDLIATKILTAVKDFVKVSSDFCVIVIMSHGEEDDLVIGDDKAKTEVKEIVDVVAHSEALKGKPKLLFFQMCRGKKLTRDHIDGTPLNTNDSGWVMDMLTSLLPSGRILGSHVSAVDEPAEEHISGIKDVMLAFATQPDHKAFRDGDKGSWFIQELARVFADRAHEDDVVNMMDEVKRRVKTYTAYAPGEDHHECVASVDGSNTFKNKKLYLFPGFPPTHKE